MKCPHCGKRVAESAKYCRGCGASLEPTTQILDGTPPHAATGDEQSGKPPAEAEPRREGAGLNIDLKDIAKAAVKCAWMLALSALLIHLASMYLTAYIPIAAAPPEAKGSSRLDLFYYVGQAVLTGGFTFFIFTSLGAPRMDESRWGKIARETFQQFLKGWSAIWVSWFLLYFYLTVVMGVERPTDEQNVTFQVVVDFLNIANSAAFFYVFLVLDMPSVRTTEQPLRNREFQRAFKVVVLICSAIFLYSAICRFTQQKYGPYLSGLLVGISMAYVFGRLDSHYMNVKRWTLAPLYLYAVIQVLGPVLIDSRDISKEMWLLQSLFFGTVLVLKIWMFIMVNIWLQNGSFDKYFNTVPEYIEGIRAKGETTGE